MLKPIICFLFLLFLRAPLIASESDVSFHSSYRIIEGKVGAKMVMSVVIENTSQKEIYIPTRNIGPLISFTPKDKSAEIWFKSIPRHRAQGGYYIESEYDYSPVRLAPGEATICETSIEVFKNETFGLVEVIYDTTGSQLSRFNFSKIKLTGHSVIEK